MARIYKTTYEDVYKFHAKFGRVPPQDRSDDYWKSLVYDMGEYSKAHDDKFTTAMTAEIIWGLLYYHVRVWLA